MTSRCATREQLDELVLGGCEGDGELHSHSASLFLHARCHIQAGLEAEYTLGGELAVRCLVCGKPVVTVMVESGATT